MIERGSLREDGQQRDVLQRLARLQHTIKGYSNEVYLTEPPTPTNEHNSGHFKGKGHRHDEEPVSLKTRVDKVARAWSLDQSWCVVLLHSAMVPPWLGATATVATNEHRQSRALRRQRPGDSLGKSGGSHTVPAGKSLVLLQGPAGKSLVLLQVPAGKSLVLLQVPAGKSLVLIQVPTGKSSPPPGARREESGPPPGAPHREVWFTFRGPQGKSLVHLQGPAVEESGPPPGARRGRVWSTSRGPAHGPDWRT
ncbi:hypothetical protein NHX12_025702, partial [Muraenolepis orangiensis]